VVVCEHLNADSCKFWGALTARCATYTVCVKFSRWFVERWCDSVFGVDCVKRFKYSPQTPTLGGLGRKDLGIQFRGLGDVCELSLIKKDPKLVEVQVEFACGDVSRHSVFIQPNELIAFSSILWDCLCVCVCVCVCVGGCVWVCECVGVCLGVCLGVFLELHQPKWTEI
jgi:hypothetical protein